MCGLFLKLRPYPPLATETVSYSVLATWVGVCLSAGRDGLGSKSVARLFRRNDEIIAQQLVSANGIRVWWIELYYGEMAFRKVTSPP